MRFKQYILNEKQIEIIGTKGNKYGNVIFLAGGGASGKGFARENFIHGEQYYKVRDIDEYKKAFIKLSQMTDKYPELKNLKLTKPEDVGKLHAFVSKRKIKDRTLNYVLQDLKQDRLPNLIFDITFQWIKKVVDPVERLIKLGYNPKDINLIWILTDYKIAVAQNLNPDRGRIVPADILLQSHEGAALNMYDIIKRGVGGLGRDKLDGKIAVILGGKDNTIYWKDKDGNEIKTKPSIEAYKKIYGKEPKNVEKFMKPKPVIKGFKYIVVKEKGKALESNKEILTQLHKWITDNIPQTYNTSNIWVADPETRATMRSMSERIKSD